MYLMYAWNQESKCIAYFRKRFFLLLALVFLKCKQHGLLKSVHFFFTLYKGEFSQKLHDDQQKDVTLFNSAPI